MKAEPLTPLRIRSLKPPESGRTEIADGATAGLCLRISADNSRTWTLRMRDPVGKLRRFVLGDMTETQGLAWARRQAERLRQQVRHEGRDPHRERREATAAAKSIALRSQLTLEALTDEWKERRLSSRRPRYATEAVRALRVAFSDQWAQPAEDLDAMTVSRVLARMASGHRTDKGIVRTRHAMASRTAAYGKACFGWAVKRQLVPNNPFAIVPTDDFRSPARDRVLTDTELVAVWHATNTAAAFDRLVRFLLLTGQRREEASQMRWSEVEEDGVFWTIPGQRTKNGKPHLVPLSETSLSVMGHRPSGEASKDDLVFPGQRGTAFSGWSKCKAQLDLASGVTGWRIHDLRRTLATGLQRLGVRLEVTEAVLNHISGSRAGIVGVYQRYDWAAEKAAALRAWAERVEELVRPSDAQSNPRAGPGAAGLPPVR